MEVHVNEESGASLEFDFNLNDIEINKKNETAGNSSSNEQLELGSSSGSNQNITKQGSSNHNPTVLASASDLMELEPNQEIPHQLAGASQTLPSIVTEIETVNQRPAPNTSVEARATDLPQWSQQFPQLDQINPFPNLPAPHHHYPMSLRPEHFLDYPYSNISKQQPANVNDRTSQIPDQAVGARLRFQPVLLQYHHDQQQSSQPMLSSAMEIRSRRNDERYERSPNEVARSSYISTSSPDTTYQQIQLELEIFKSSKEQISVPEQPSTPISRRIKKRTRNANPKQFLTGESSSPSANQIGSWRMTNQPNHDLPSTADLDSSERRITNALYDPMFEEVGLPIDPHLRLFNPQL